MQSKGSKKVKGTEKRRDKIAAVAERIKSAVTDDGGQTLRSGQKELPSVFAISLARVELNGNTSIF